MKAERRTPIRDGGFGFREVGRAEIRGEGVPKDGRSPRLAVCHANAGSYATVESPGGGARAAVGMASNPPGDVVVRHDGAHLEPADLVNG